MTDILNQAGRKSSLSEAHAARKQLAGQAQNSKLLHFGAFSLLLAHKLSHDGLFSEIRQRENSEGCRFGTVRAVTGTAGATESRLEKPREAARGISGAGNSSGCKASSLM